MRKDREDIKKLYEEGGYSCSQLGKMLGITRQSVHEMLTSMNTTFRKNKQLPFIMYDGLKWTVSKTNGYYRSTTHRKKHLSLHRYVWIKHNGEIPDNTERRPRAYLINFGHGGRSSLQFNTINNLREIFLRGIPSEEEDDG